MTRSLLRFAKLLHPNFFSGKCFVFSNQKVSTNLFSNSSMWIVSSSKYCCRAKNGCFVEKIWNMAENFQPMLCYFFWWPKKLVALHCYACFLDMLNMFMMSLAEFLDVAIFILFQQIIVVGAFPNILGEQYSFSSCGIRLVRQAINFLLQQLSDPKGETNGSSISRIFFRQITRHLSHILLSISQFLDIIRKSLLAYIKPLEVVEEKSSINTLTIMPSSTNGSYSGSSLSIRQRSPERRLSISILEFLKLISEWAPNT